MRAPRGKRQEPSRLGNDFIAHPWITPTTSGVSTSGSKRPSSKPSERKHPQLLTSWHLARLALDRGNHDDPDDLLARRLRGEGWGFMANPELVDLMRQLLRAIDGPDDTDAAPRKDTGQ